MSETNTNTNYNAILLTNTDGTGVEYGNNNKASAGPSQKQSSITPSTNSVSLSYAQMSAVVTLSVVGDGEVFVYSSDETICTATLLGNAVTISGQGSSGSATITVGMRSTATYSSSFADISVQSDYALKSFAAATDEELVGMVAAADSGFIDLYEDAGWRVGDQRQTTLAAIPSSGTFDGVSWSVGESQEEQTVTLVLMHHGLYTLVDPVLDKQGQSRSVCSFVVGLKNNLTTYGHMNSTNTNNGSWNSSARRGWCNGGFRQAVNSTLRAAFKKFNCITAQTYNGSTNQTTQDYFALPAAAEVFKGDPTYGQSGSSAGPNTTAFSNLTEFNALTRFTWYENTANRIKTTGNTVNASPWWERSPRYNDSQSFTFVALDGSASNIVASFTELLSPFGCL